VPTRSYHDWFLLNSLEHYIAHYIEPLVIIWTSYCAVHRDHSRYITLNITKNMTYQLLVLIRR